MRLLRRINTLSDEQMEALYHAIRERLQVGIDLGGSHWEQNLYGEHGRWDCSYFLVASGERKPCPMCGTAVRMPSRINERRTKNGDCGASVRNPHLKCLPRQAPDGREGHGDGG